MKQFKSVFKFEFLSLIKAKAFIVTTAILIIIITGAFFVIPSLGGLDSPSSKVADAINAKNSYVFYDANNSIDDFATIKVYFPKSTFKEVDSLDELKAKVKSGKYDAGFYIKDALNYDYYVENSNLMDMTTITFSAALTQNYKGLEFKKLGVDDKKALELTIAEAKGETIAINNDGAENFITVMILIIAIYMITIIYGQIVATRVASEKGNRTMELLVTSANSNALIFGKVFATCLAAFIQVSIVIITAVVCYQVNGDAWHGMLDMVFNIPSEVAVAFLLFGVTGLILYAFIFGVLGALVDKSEDVNSSATPVTIIFVLVYLAVYYGLMEGPNSTTMVVLSYIPFSSPMAMFARMAMSSVAIYETIISFLILIGSTILVGIFGSKIYRRATLMYGNQIKLGSALKWLKK